jgi:hypothetical protein
VPPDGALLCQGYWHFIIKTIKKRRGPNGGECFLKRSFGLRISGLRIAFAFEEEGLL